ncbi:MAG: lipopolysaccharide heptosyltransferase II [Candidatus Omnitrophota bacterium]|nr:lipopolysaccharide heptosyltransferase II [Candidatus Omnitrophota bacterium]
MKGLPPLPFTFHLSPFTSPLPSPRRILVIRLDRIGDVVLSTPVFQALRRQFPHAFIAAMVRPACRDVVEGHPALDEVILYDKDGRHRRLTETIRFARRLRRTAFDTALILHPTNRSHWITWLAGIPVRIGYDRKSAWLLTHRIPHRKHEGVQHEAAYTLEMLRVFDPAIGPGGLHIPPPPPEPLIRIHPQAEQRVDVLLAEVAIQPADRLVAVHPSASCVSKRWLPERFAEVADRLIEERGVRVCLVAGEDDVLYALRVAQAMRRPAVNLAGRLSLGELAALLRRCRLLISNDSGPVHVAAAVGTTVVDLFGRNQRGLSPARWGPIGQGHVILHKEVGCVTCLAHRCDIGFLCLTSLSVEEVYQASVAVLDRQCLKSTSTPQRAQNSTETRRNP